MRTSVVIFVLALASLAIAGVLPDSTAQILKHTPNPNDIFRHVSFKALQYCDPEVEVDVTEVEVGWHGVAFVQFKALYPLYISSPIHRCRYSTLGITRFYTFTVSVGSTTKDVKTAIQVEDDSKTTKTSSSPDEKEGYSEVSVSWAEKDPQTSYALNFVIKVNWNIILGNPLKSCWAKPFNGVWLYRFYFKNVEGKFQYSVAEKHQDDDKKKSDSHYTEIEPIFVVGEASQYKSFDIESFKKDPSYPTVVEQLHSTLGHFDQKWILNVSVSISNECRYLKITINFQPFLVKQNYQAQYYGSTKKAALLKIDEAVFNGNGKSYKDWQQIKNFDSFKAFHEAHQYILSQFTWLRFYTVTAAYSALHLKGRYVRLVYQGIAAYVDPKNQINIVIFIDECGRYFLVRNDFLATHLYSFGRNNWVSLFIQTPDATKAEFYQEIVHFYKAIYPKFWSANQIVDIKFKDDLHVVKFQNPTHLSVACLNVNGSRVQVLNNFNWILISDNSPLVGRIENYVRGKNNVSSIIFIQYLDSDNGTHFEVAYLDGSNAFQTAYILYIPANDAFTDDNGYTFASRQFGNDSYIDPLPKEVKGSIVDFIQHEDPTCIAVLSYVSLSPRSFAIIGISGGKRWQYIINWVDGKWKLVSKQPYSDGFYSARGIPSASTASCTGFLRKLYPRHFAAPFLYVLIETKSVGIHLYNRIIFNFGVVHYEGVVSTTFGIQSSQVLHSWQPILFVKPKGDYGYGKDANINYGVDASLLYNHETKPSNLSVQPEKKDKDEDKDDKLPTCPQGTRKYYIDSCLPVF